MGSSKGQSANELLVIYMFVMLVFTIFVADFSRQRSAEMQNARIAAADSVGEQFANELNFAARAGSGYSKKFIYPVLLQGVIPYTIILNTLSKSVDIQFSMGTVNYSHSFPIISSNVVVEPTINATLPNGQPYGYILQSSNYSFSSGQIYVQNINGVIVVSMASSYSPNAQRIEMGVSGSYISMGYNFANVTARVTDVFGDTLPDGTLVHFSTPNGIVDDYATTVNGTATALLIATTSTSVTASISGVSNKIQVPFSSGG